MEGNTFVGLKKITLNCFTASKYQNKLAKTQVLLKKKLKKKIIAKIVKTTSLVYFFNIPSN